ncbi:hypothetical protein BESB_062970 [Besnoitia besnoiti]|uniref:Uncharacterized protein n=1 Tax=Besnoitia besnoiti TaxID=94643 RepID=A0A2A9MJ39_BESBE|nr:hypothetical protein BESB_062970 [Besnoitia besnoiti]PFH35410.1 hypothetical protein BESB_062970 [Besnoitia besnoiti]
MALFACCNCDPEKEEETQVNVETERPRSDSSTDGLPLTPEQKQKEKERLQALVKAFAKAAVSGASCYFIDVSSQQKIPANYMLDKSLKTFTVAFPSGVEHSFSLSSLQDAYSYEDLLHSESTASLVQEPGISNLSEDDKRKLVMLEYLDASQRRLNRLFLMETGTDEMRDRFLTCMRILKLYSRTPGHSETNGTDHGNGAMD